MYPCFSGNDMSLCAQFEPLDTRSGDVIERVKHLSSTVEYLTCGSCKDGKTDKVPPQKKRALASSMTYVCDNNECVATIAEKLGCDAHALLLLNRQKYRGLTLNAKLWAKTRLQVPLEASKTKIPKLSSKPSSKGKEAVYSQVSAAARSVTDSPILPSPSPYQISTPIGGDTAPELSGLPSSGGSASDWSALDTPICRDLARPGSRESWKVGDRVEARFCMRYCKGWYAATIETVLGDGTYLVSWEDGDASDRVKQARHIRPASALALASGAQSSACPGT